VRADDDASPTALRRPHEGGRHSLVIILARLRVMVDDLRDEISYEPRADGRPDPGEVVWARVPFEEGIGRRAGLAPS
jgi:hypothetical protein